MNFAILQFREKLDNISFALPQEAGRPTIIKADPSASPIISLVLSYKNLTPYPGKENKTTSLNDFNQLESIESVSSVFYPPKFQCG